MLIEVGLDLAFKWEEVHGIVLKISQVTADSL